VAGSVGCWYISAPLRIFGEMESFMPYFVYKISPDRKTLTQIDAHEKYKAAKDQCRQLRQAQDQGDMDMIRLVFAKDKREAEVLLSEKHKPSSPLEEWEG